MSKVLTRLLLFFIAFFLIDFVTGKMCLWMMSHAKPSAMKNMYEIYRGSNADIVVLGSSRAMHHYDSRIIEDSIGMKCMNYGAMSNGILLMYGRYKMLIKKHSPQLIIYDLHPPLDIEKSDNSKYIPTLRPFADDEDISNYICRIDSGEKIKLHSFLYRFNSLFPELLTTQFKCDNNLFGGYSPLQGTMKVTPSYVEHEIIEPDTLKLNILEEMISDCHKRGIRICFFVSPAFNHNFSNAAKPYLQLLKKYGVICYCYDTKGSFPMDKQLFYDSRHLNDKGVNIYTKMIIPHVKKAISQ